MKALVIGEDAQLWMVIKIYIDGDGNEEISCEPIKVFFNSQDAESYRQKLYKQMVDSGVDWIINDGTELIPDWDSDAVEYYYASKIGEIEGDQNVEETH